MPGRDIIGMSVGELRRLSVLDEAMAGRITQRKAAEALELCERQVRRLIKSIRVEGACGLAHKSRGRPSNNRIGEEVRAKAIEAYRASFSGFGPTLASEKLREREGIVLSAETLRKWLIVEGLWSRRRKRSPHRRRRERRECFGELLQMDGSHHDWLEGRGPRLVLMGLIDDATGRVHGRFYDYEGTVPAMESLKGYARKYGLPQSIYVDKHTTYKSTARAGEEDLYDRPMSQFERAMEELGVKVIHADSPQAKGRVERLFGTLQDRLVKEMRLKGIRTKEEANAFLKHYLPAYNKKFGVPAARKANLHVPLPKGLDLDDFLCIKTNRVIRRDNTVSLGGRLFQIESAGEATHAELQERLDGRLVIKAGGKALNYSEIGPAQSRASSKRRASKVVRRSTAPGPDHPWRQGLKSKRLAQANAY